MKQGCIDLCGLCEYNQSDKVVFDRGYSSFSTTSILKVKCGKNVM